MHTLFRNMEKAFKDLKMRSLLCIIYKKKSIQSEIEQPRAIYTLYIFSF